MAMDITSAPATRTALDSDADTPPRPTSNNKPMGFLAYANGALKRHYPTAPGPAKAESRSYKECMRNHAASIGGHALDGCCEFMPSPMFSPSDPTSLRCAACGCHRNFHRREAKTGPPPADSPPAPLQTKTAPPPSSPQIPTALKNSGGKKRFRTKFSQEQKEKMYDFAERWGWKMQKMDKVVVEDFCAEIGVGKEVLKVWLHNNKNTRGGGGGGPHFKRIHLLPANASSSSSG